MILFTETPVLLLKGPKEFSPDNIKVVDFQRDREFLYEVKLRKSQFLVSRAMLI